MVLVYRGLCPSPFETPRLSGAVHVAVAHIVHGQAGGNEGGGVMYARIDCRVVPAQRRKGVR